MDWSTQWRPAATEKPRSFSEVLAAYGLNDGSFSFATVKWDGEEWYDPIGESKTDTPDYWAFITKPRV